MFKIKFNEQTLYIVADVCEFNLDSIDKKKAVTYRYSKPKQLKEILEEMKTFKIKSHIIYHSNPQEVFDEISNNFSLIKAAGGLIVNEKNQILFIFRNGKWDLPKGKVEKNESNEHAAIRESEEECGVKISYLKQQLLITYHTYTYESKSMLKANYWFLMFADSQQNLTPQLEENIEKVEWKFLEEIPALLENSYDSIRDVLQVYTSLGAN